MDRMSNISPFIVMDIVREASKREDIIHFEVGQPDMPPSKNVISAFQKASFDNKFQYTDSTGIVELKIKISEFYKQKYNLNIASERIIITSGTSAAFLTTYSLLLNMGESIALADPTYPCYRNFSHLLYINPLMINVDKSTNYQLTVSQINKGIDAIKAVQISSPSNPTGSIYGKDSLKSLINFCVTNGTYFISDEIYHGLVYDNEMEHSALEFSDDAFVINGFSKYFCMPGIRLGWVIVPEKFIRDAEKLIQNIYICPPTLSQYAALEAFDYEYLDKIRTEYQCRRDFLYSELSKLFNVDVKPKGAFYIWADISRFSSDCYDFTMKLLDEAGVAVTPGIDFGRNNTVNYIRFAYTRNIEHMKDGINRIKQFLKNY